MSDGDAAEAERREAEMWAAFEAEHQPILLDRALMVALAVRYPGNDQPVRTFIDEVSRSRPMLSF